MLWQICHEFERFSTYLPDIKVAVFYGGVNIKVHKDLLKNECPHIVVGTPGRILALSRDKDLSLKNVRHFILDECDKMLESLGMLSNFHKSTEDILFIWYFFLFFMSSFFFCYCTDMRRDVQGIKRSSRWPHMISKLWCFQLHLARKFNLCARNLCKM